MSKTQFITLIILMILFFIGAFLLIFWHPGVGFITVNKVNWWTNALCISNHGELIDEGKLYHQCIINETINIASFEHRGKCSNSTNYGCYKEWGFNSPKN